MKKFLALFLAFAFVASVLTSTSGCGGDAKKPADAPKADPTKKADEPKK